MDGIESRAPAAEDPHNEVLGPQGRTLLLVFAALERAEIAYCVTHGYESYPERILSSDVDVLVSADIRPAALAALASEAAAGAGGALVAWRDGYVVLAGRNCGRAPWFLAFDFRADCTLGALCFLSGGTILERRRRYKGFYIAAPDDEFGCLLLRRIVKGDLDERHMLRLDALYRCDPAACRPQLARFWPPYETARLEFAALSGCWEAVKGDLPDLSRTARDRALLRNPGRACAAFFHRLRRRVQLACWPEGGLSLILLGPDGAGKSSTASAIVEDLAPAFGGTRQRSFPPGLLRRLHRSGQVCPAHPHALPPRSRLMSVLRAICYWSAYQLVLLRLAGRVRAARSMLTVHDRHLVDALVDPRRYRYGGPVGLLRAIWRLGPQADLVVLLDAPAEVLQARKQEVPFEETARQREAYRALVGAMTNGHIVDATRPFEEVVAAIDDLVLRTLSARVAKRLARGRRGSRHGPDAIVIDPGPTAPVSAAEP